MKTCYTFHTFLLKQLKNDFTLHELSDLLNCNIYNLSKWLNDRHPIPQKYLPNLESVAFSHFKEDTCKFFKKYVSFIK